MLTVYITDVKYNKVINKKHPKTSSSEHKRVLESQQIRSDQVLKYSCSNSTSIYRPIVYQYIY